jgi:inositol phosphorylceramide mannosyltransferase catalytic subunit
MSLVVLGSPKGRSFLGKAHLANQLYCAHRHLTSQLNTGSDLSTKSSITPQNRTDSNAQQISPRTLLRMPAQSQNKTNMSKIIHQSWSSTSIPPHLASMAETWKRDYPDWSYVLWTDADNLALVQERYPALLPAYLALPREIWRADMIRPLYMHAFGGIYIDLDMDSIRPLDHEFARMAKVAGQTPSETAYVAKMGPDRSFPHSIPNAFMASGGSGHPFWLQFTRSIVERVTSETADMQSPEYTTGPVALWEEVDRYEGEGLLVLPPQMIFPHSWMHASEEANCVCWSAMITFNRKACQALYPGAWAITYWNHAW